MEASEQEDAELSPEQADEMLRGGAVELIDVREPYEYEAGHIAGTRHIQLAQLSAAAETIDRERPVIFYCRVGNRSGMAMEAFRASGFRAFNLSGGLVAWTESGLPIEPDDGHVADH